jgi:hypothetical protein
VSAARAAMALNSPTITGVNQVLAVFDPRCPHSNRGVPIKK